MNTSNNSKQAIYFASFAHLGNVIWHLLQINIAGVHPDEDDSAEDDEVADEDEEEPGMFDDAEEETNGAGEAGDGPEQMDAD